MIVDQVAVVVAKFIEDLIDSFDSEMERYGGGLALSGRLEHERLEHSAA